MSKRWFCVGVLAAVLLLLGGGFWISRVESQRDASRAAALTQQVVQHEAYARVELAIVVSDGKSPRGRRTVLANGTPIGELSKAKQIFSVRNHTIIELDNTTTKEDISVTVCIKKNDEEETEQHTILVRAGQIVPVTYITAP